MTSWRNHLSEWKTHVDAIRQILLLEWDPIGGGSGLIPADEYDGYIPVIYRLMQEHVGVEALARHLSHIERERIGMTPSNERNLEVAKNLMALVE
jgi:hypothetical protein